ncbi:hypothetical protein [Pseudomonas sp. YJ42]|uniref:hypothetical protein n=1 Tax=Pseudomonas sp. YJ42 TaxID=3392115 RepID=UPI0039A043FF
MLTSQHTFVESNVLQAGQSAGATRWETNSLLSKSASDAKHMTHDTKYLASM